MGMRQFDIIGIVGKTQDATQAQQANTRAHAVQQDQIASQQASRAEQASEQVSALEQADRLELSTGDEGGSGGGGGSHGHPQGEQTTPEEEIESHEHQIDFLA